MLRGRWGVAIGFGLLFLLLIMATAMIPYVGGLAGLIIDGPLYVGSAMFFLTFIRRGRPEIGMLFGGFKNFGNALGAYLLMALFTFLWMLLLIVPGIIAAYRYSQTFYLLADNPRLGPLEAIRASTAMMRGRKWKLFCLNLRFVGWSLLCLLTCGIGYIWLMPYASVSFSRFYEDLHPAAGVPAPVAG